ncbi:glycosyltransferase family 2 protein [Candidatus Roizmanbacteria bacterium]|nr:glycosyltransferase family 2 protein [Candidatus Roizmanbacteria bacterium]
MRKLISIGIPCFNEEPNVIPCYQALRKVASQLKKYDFEFVFVDNGSLDGTREKIIQVAKKDRRVVGVFLSRNFGPEATPQAAVDHASGDAFILFEGDLQDPPELIKDLVKKWEQGYQVVVGTRTKIEDNFIMTLARRTFYKIFKKISNIDVPVNAGSYGIIDKKVIQALKALPEKYRFYRGLRSWLGFRTTYIKYKRRERERGKSSYNFIDYIKHAERGFFGFSYLVLDLMVYGGFLLVVVSFLFLIWYLFIVFAYGNPINASIPIMLAIVFFGGVQLLAISIIGKYIQVIMEETKARPVYIVDDTVNLKS